MENIRIKAETVKKTFTYVGENLYVDGDIEFDSKTKVISTIHGDCYLKEYGTDQKANYIGNFYGWKTESGIKYDLHDVTSENTTLIAEVVSELGPNLDEIVDQEMESEEEPASEE